MSAQIDVPKYTYLKRGVYYFVISLCLSYGPASPAANWNQSGSKISETKYETVKTESVESVRVKIKRPLNCPKSGSRSSASTYRYGNSLNWPAGLLISDFGTCALHILFFPSNYDKPPLEKGILLREGETRLEFLGDIAIDQANVRESVAVTLADGSKAIAYVETGLEYPRKNWKKWPHGFARMARLDGDQVVLDKLFSEKAFYHSIASADINGDGLDDLVLQTMGSRGPLLSKQNHNLVVLTQTKSSKFVYQPKAIKGRHLSGGAVQLADLDGDGVAELIQGAYKKKRQGFSSMIKLFRWSGNRFELAGEIKRSGIMGEGAGISKISIADFDQDGTHDLLVNVEGKRKGLMLLKNLGNLKFEDISKKVLPNIPTDTKKYQWREAVVADVNQDQLPDIVMQGWAGTEHQTVNGYDLGAGVLLNQGKVFKRLSNSPSLFFKDGQRPKRFFRFIQHQGRNLFFAVGVNSEVTRFEISPRLFR